MKKKANVIKQQLKEIKHNKHASRLLKVLQATGLFRWERPSTKAEETLNILTHGIGIGLAIAALCVMVVFAVLHHNIWAIVSCSIFGLTMFTLYFGSTMCHATIGDKSECFFEVWDSVAIYALIAGTYTPFLLVNLRGGLGWTMFGILWAIVIFGSIMKFKNPRREPKWMVLLYMVMGWALIWILPAMIKHISARGMWFVLSGALSYSVGVIFYLWRKMKFSHALWHLFVIGGSVCFFFAILFGSIIDFIQ
ncbi:MAG: hemolysin III family protein [Alphaproteobacteria bacterium]|nr:hemolysin III family protein [Alphaproteobacteria bacterium]